MLIVLASQLTYVSIDQGYIFGIGYIKVQRISKRFRLSN